MLAGFTAGLLFITVSELGDKTFFIAAILAMRHGRRWVFLGAIAALALMTIISVLLGQAVLRLLPPQSMKIATVALFFGFGLMLLYQASRMSATPDNEECDAAELAVEKADAKLQRQGAIAIITQAFALTFVGEWGDRTQITTITLAATQNPIGVTLGSILGHAICAAIAVFCGKLICGRISERTLTAIGGGLFVLFGILALFH
jgi:Ca2+/H+ antiporter, TMEM165/GDT1 family